MKLGMSSWRQHWDFGCGRKASWSGRMRRVLRAIGKNRTVRTHRSKLISSRLLPDFAQRNACSMRGLQQRDYFGVIFSTDWKEARVLQGKFSPVYFGDKGVRTIHDELEARAEQLVAQHWSAIEVLAEALLSRRWEPKKPFKSGTQWSDSEQAKYLLGAEIVEILAALGISAQSTPPL